jgi:hypothetical protein
MEKTILLLIIFGLLAIIGAYAVVKAVRKIRTPRTYKDAVFTWVEHPGLTFKDDLPTWLAITIHRLALIGLGLLAVLTVLLHPLDSLGLPGLSDSATPAFLVEPLLYATMAFIGFLWGYSLFGPIAEWIGGDRHYAISSDGVLIGGQLMPWNSLSHFDVDAGQNVIHVWSASLHGTPAMVLALPTSEALLKLSGILQNYLPASDPFSPGLIRRYVFPALMAGLSAPFIVVACLLYRAPAGIALIADAILIWALIELGGMLIMRLIYGGKARRAPME